MLICLYACLCGSVEQFCYSTHRPAGPRIKSRSRRNFVLSSYTSLATHQYLNGLGFRIHHISTMYTGCSTAQHTIYDKIEITHPGVFMFFRCFGRVLRLAVHPQIVRVTLADHAVQRQLLNLKCITQINYHQSWPRGSKDFVGNSLATISGPYKRIASCAIR